MTEFNLDIAKQLTQDAEANEFSVDFDMLWQWCGYSSKHKAKEQLVRNFEKDMDYVETLLRQTGEWASTEGSSDQPPIRTIKIWTTPDCAKEFGMLAKTEKGKQVRKYFIRAEKELRRSMQENPLAHLEYMRAVLDQQIKQGYNLQLTKQTVEEQQLQLENHENRIDATEDELQVLKEEIDNNRNNPNVNNMCVSLRTYCDHKGFVLDKTLRAVGRTLTKFCNVAEIEFRDNNGSRGNEYPYWLLDALFETAQDFDVNIAKLVSAYVESFKE